MNDIIYKGRIPACGVYCGGCPNYTRLKKPCKDAEYSDRCERCKTFHLCCKERGITYCYQCPIFPCPKFKSFAKRWLKYGQDFIENQRLLSLGTDIFLNKYNNRIHFETERLVIRLAKPEDAAGIFSYRSDYDENKYQGWFPDSMEEVRDYIKNMPKVMDVADVCFQFVIILASENRLIGDMGIIFTNHNNMQAEIGCTLHKDYQRKGYATEALKAMVGFLFETLNKRRIIASIDPRNAPSIQLIERLGFRKEAHFRESYYLRGEWVDDIIYAKLKREWADDR